MITKYQHRIAVNRYVFGQEGTIVLDLPSASVLLAHVPQFENTITLNCGLALKNPLDQFNKKLGRKLSDLRKAPVVFNIISVECGTADKLYFTLTGIVRSKETSRPVYVNLSLSVAKGSEDVKIDSWVAFREGEV